MTVHIPDYMLCSPVSLSSGSFMGPFTVLVKSFLQGKAFNDELPERGLQRNLFYLALSVDAALWFILLGIHLIGIYLIINSLGGLF